MPCPRLTEAQRALAARHVAFALDMARKFALSRGQDSSDYEGAAFLAMTDAAGRFRESLGFEFTTFSGRAIARALAEAYRKAPIIPGPRPRRGAAPPPPAPQVRGLVDDAEPSLGRESDPSRPLEDLEQLDAMLEELPEAHRALLRETYGRGPVPSRLGSPAACTAHRDALDTLAGRPPKAWRADAGGPGGTWRMRTHLVPAGGDDGA